MANVVDTGQYRVAIVGAGIIAASHAGILREMPHVKLVAVCDSVPGKAEAFACELEGSRAYTSLDQMLESAKPDVVHVTTPPNAHASNGVTCLDAGAAVLIEKPLATSATECEALVRAAARSGRPAGVNHNLIFHPSVRHLLSAIRQGRLGGIEHVSISYTMPLPTVAKGPYSHWLFRETENLVLEIAPHPLSIVERLLGKVHATRTLVSGEMTLPSGVRFFPTWQVAMQCQRGTAHLYLSVAATFADTSIRVQGEDGVAEVNLRRNTFRISEKSHLLRPNDDLRDCLRNGAAIAGDGLRNFKDYILSSLGRPVAYPASHSAMGDSIRAFYAALSAGSAPPVDLAEGTAVVKACEAAVAPVLETTLITQPV